MNLQKLIDFIWGIGMFEDLSRKHFKVLKYIRPYDEKPNLYQMIRQDIPIRKQIEHDKLLNSLHDLEELGYLKIWTRDEDQAFRKAYPLAEKLADPIREDDIMVSLSSNARGIVDDQLGERLWSLWWNDSFVIGVIGIICAGVGSTVTYVISHFT